MAVRAQAGAVYGSSTNSQFLNVFALTSTLNASVSFLEAKIQLVEEAVRDMSNVRGNINLTSTQLFVAGMAGPLAGLHDSIVRLGLSTSMTTSIDTLFKLTADMSLWVSRTFPFLSVSPWHFPIPYAPAVCHAVPLRCLRRMHLEGMQHRSFLAHTC